MRHAANLVVGTIGAVLCVTLCGSSPASDLPSGQPDTAGLADLRVSTEVSWSNVIFNNQPERFLNVRLIARGRLAAGASACGDLQVDSIKDENGRSLKARLMFLAGMLLVHRESLFPEHPKGGVQIVLELRNPGGLEKLRELRGSFALQTGGYLQSLILKDALEQTGGTIEDATLKRLGVTVRMVRTPPHRSCVSEAKLPNSSTPGEMEDSRVEFEFDVTTSDSPVIRLEIIDPDGKPYAPNAFEFERSIKKAMFSFRSKPPDGSHLRLTIHRDSKTLRVPFVFRDIAVPPETASETKPPNALTPVPADRNWPFHLVPDTVAPMQLERAR